MTRPLEEVAATCVLGNFARIHDQDTIGKIGHNFVIGGIQTPILKSGQSATIIVTLKKGKMAYLCSVAGHPALGMKGKLVVI